MFWISLSALATSVGSTESLQVVWPERDDLVHSDVVVYAVDALAAPQDMVLLDGNDAVVPTTIKQLDGVDNRTWWALVPDSALWPGLYSVNVNSSPPYTFYVDDLQAPEVEPPAPHRRLRESCSGTLTLAYRACSDAVLHLVAVGDVQPNPPTLDDLGQALVGDEASEWFDVPMADGFPVTVWVGGLDQAGRFSGWWVAETVQAPDEELVIQEAPMSANANAGTTPTAPVCAEDSPWEVIAEESCTGQEDTGGGDETETTEGCGCQSTSAANGVWGLLGLLGVRRLRSL